MAYSINDNCIGCTLCARNCPVKAISGAIKEKHAIKAERCVECGVCANFCSKEAVLKPDGQIAPKLPKTQWLKPIVDKSLCSACGMCVDICSPSCITISMPAFQGDIDVHAELSSPGKCIGCRLCAKICPLAAITMGEVQTA